MYAPPIQPQEGSMNWEVIGIVSQVASAFAVVVTLVYLASQNSQANAAAATATTIVHGRQRSLGRQVLLRRQDRWLRRQARVLRHQRVLRRHRSELQLWRRGGV